MKTKPRLLRVTTVPVSLKLLLDGQFTFFQSQGFDVLTVSADGPEVFDLQQEGVRHAVVPLTRMITPLTDLYCLFRLILLIIKFKPGIVHTHTPKAGLLGMLAAWICRVPTRMHTVAGLPLMEAKGAKKWVLKITERITYSCAHRVYPNSRGLTEYILSEFPAHKSRISMIGKGSSNGIDIGYFSRNEELEQKAKAIRARYEIGSDTIVFSFVGRIVKDKGIIELVEAVQKLDNVRLLLIGPFEQDLDPLPDDTYTFINTDKRVILTGFQNDVRPWLMASDIFVFPSYREGFPNVVMQAACLETPCIVSDINGCNELNQHEKTGLIVPTKNAEKLFDAMKLMASDTTKARQMALRASEFVRSNFRREVVWQLLLGEYRNHLIT
jgi:glycosyltransferase involved in cell wall biosynthesis